MVPTAAVALSRRFVGGTGCPGLVKPSVDRIFNSVVQAEWPALPASFSTFSSEECILLRRRTVRFAMRGTYTSTVFCTSSPPTGHRGSLAGSTTRSLTLTLSRLLPSIPELSRDRSGGRAVRTGLTIGISHSFPRGGATAARVQSACSPGLLGPVTIMQSARWPD